jgi:hypothetical protein
MSNQIQTRLEALNAGPSIGNYIAVRVHLRNTGTIPVVIPMQALSSPSLLFELVDKHGEKVPFPPPPIPDPHAGSISIASGQTWQNDYMGFLPAAPPGTYQLRVCIHGDIKILSDWLVVKLR